MLTPFVSSDGIQEAKDKLDAQREEIETQLKVSKDSSVMPLLARLYVSVGRVVARN